MRSRLIGGVAVIALVFFAFAPAARADNIGPLNSRLGPNNDVVPENGGWMNGQSFLARLNVQTVDGQLVGTWDFERENPFRDLAVDRGFDAIGIEAARAFLSSRHASSSQTAELDFNVDQAGDHDADDMDDFHVTLANATLSPAARTMTSGTTAKFGTAGQPLPTPEPASLILLGSGLAGLGLVGMRRKKRVAARREL